VLQKNLKQIITSAHILYLWTNGQGRIRGRFDPQNISNQFIGDPMQKNVMILLVINLSKIVRTGRHFEAEYMQKSIGFSLSPYLSSISPKCTIFWQCFKLNLYWLERAFNSASFHIRIAIILLKNGS
jgi:hypothetical protein